MQEKNMQKIKTIAILFLLTVISFLFPRTSWSAEEQCRNNGGHCYPSTPCPPGETYIGRLDCPFSFTDEYGYDNYEVCCKPGTSGCKIDDDRCNEPKDCCSENCVFSQGLGYKVCAPKIIDTPTPSDTNVIDVSCPDGKVGVNTALGCIPTGNLNDFVGWVFKNLVFIASGIAFLLMAFGTIQILTSAGKPESVKAGSELITSAVSGLILIILSVFLLKLIGVDILHIPGFGK